MNDSEVERVLREITFGGGLAKLGAAVLMIPRWMFFNPDSDKCMIRVEANVPDRGGRGPDIQLGCGIVIDLTTATAQTIAKQVLRAFVEMMQHEACESVRFRGALVDDPHANPFRPERRATGKAGAGA